MNEEYAPVMELNKENVLRIVKMLSKDDIETIVPPSALISIFYKKPREIGKLMDELVKDGILIKKKSLFGGGYILKK